MKENNNPLVDKKIECEGYCEKYKGEVHRVKVYGTDFNGMEFNYCEEAIEEDIRRGFLVEIL